MFFLNRFTKKKDRIGQSKNEELPSVTGKLPLQRIKRQPSSDQTGGWKQS
jgi:hypothetical protein